MDQQASQQTLGARLLERTEHVFTFPVLCDLHERGELAWHDQVL